MYTSKKTKYIIDFKSTIIKQGLDKSLMQPMSSVRLFLKMDQKDSFEDFGLLPHEIRPL